MITKEQLIEELETIDDVQILEQVHQLLQQLKQPPKIALMSQLRSVPKITAPNDFAENIQPIKKHRTPPASIAGKAKILGDLVEPIFPEQDIECLN